MLPNLSNSSQCVKDPTAENNQFSQRRFQHAGQRQRSRARGAGSSAAESAEQEQLNRFIGVTCAWHGSSLIHGKEEHEQPDVGTVVAVGRRQAARDGAGVVSSRRTRPMARGQQKVARSVFGNTRNKPNSIINYLISFLIENFQIVRLHNVNAG